MCGSNHYKENKKAAPKSVERKRVVKPKVVSLTEGQELYIEFGLQDKTRRSTVSYRIQVSLLVIFDVSSTPCLFCNAVDGDRTNHVLIYPTIQSAFRRSDFSVDLQNSLGFDTCRRKSQHVKVTTAQRQNKRRLDNTDFYKVCLKCQT